MIALAFTVLALATAPGGTQPARSPAEPTAADIVARNRSATGSERREEPERERWTVRSAGLTGTLESVRDGNDNVMTTQLGPFRSQRGSFHGQRWHQNDNGETVLERLEPSQSERVATDGVSRVHDPVEAWAVTTTFASGHTLRSFYDPRTFLLVRTERTANGHTLRTTYDDFHVDAGGRVRATHYFGSDDRPGTDFDYRLALSEPAPAPLEGELAIPADRRPLVEFPAGVPQARLPARIDGGRIYVRLTVGGRALDFLLDSGSSNITLDERVAQSLGLVAYGRTTQTVAGTFASQRVIVPAVGLGTLAMHDVVMRTAPIAENEGSHTRVVGLLGFDFLDAVGLKIDYAAGTLDAIRPGLLVAPAGSIPLDLRLNTQVPVTTVTVGEATGDDFIVDTGAQFDLVLFQRFLRAHADAAHATPLARVRYGNAVGGRISYRSLELRATTLGPLAFANLDAVEALGTNALGFDTHDGLIGDGVLARFSVFFDYAANRLYLGPAGHPAPNLRARDKAPRRGGSGH